MKDFDPKPEVSGEREYVIVCTRHRSDIGKHCLLFWGRRTADSEARSFSFYTSCLDKCERYTRDEVRAYGNFLFYDPSIIWSEWVKKGDFAISVEQLKALGFMFLHVCWR